VELPCKHEALSSNPSSKKKKKNQTKQTNKKIGFYYLDSSNDLDKAVLVEFTFLE
jgi:hypothetical protein